jgi:hypothetical protein
MLCPQQTVDGLHTALEIRSRSSYVPKAPHWRPVAVFSGAPRTQLGPRLEMPIWMK